MATDDGAKRAQELNDALLGVPGYADDTMFFVARYGHKCQVRASLLFSPAICRLSLKLDSHAISLQTTLRKADFDAVMKATHDLGVAMSKANNQSRVSELRGQVMEILKPFPELTQDYDRFAASARSYAKSTTATSGRSR